MCRIDGGAGLGVATSNPAVGCRIGFIRFRKGTRLGMIAPFGGLLMMGAGRGSWFRSSAGSDRRDGLGLQCPKFAHKGLLERESEISGMGNIARTLFALHGPFAAVCGDAADRRLQIVYPEPQ